MNQETIQKIAMIRIAVAYLGEKDQNGWWQSSFFGAGSKTFLSPAFPRTERLTQYHGASTAAMRIHDERIGIGAVFHLFRLPEHLEHELHRTIIETQHADTLFAHLGNATSAVVSLRNESSSESNDAIGPVRIGGIESLQTELPWIVVGQHYAKAFHEGLQVYPYFSDVQ